MVASHREARVGKNEPTAAPHSRAERKAASRRRILDAAREVFFRDGYGSASLDEVAERAEVAKGTLYRHVESKAELYLAVLTENGERFLEEMRQSVRDRGSPLDQLHSIGEFYLDYWSRHPEYFSIFWAVRNQHLIGELPSKIVDKVSSLWSLPLRVLESVIERGIRSGEFVECDPWVMAHVIWRMGNTFFDAQSAPRSAQVIECPSKELYREGLNLILRGLIKPARSRAGGL
jgi:TetR/AcrR family transcriptional regulator